MGSHAHGPRRSPPESPAPFPVTGPAPEGGPTPTADPEVDPAAPATPPGAGAGVDGDVGEDGHTPAAAHTEVTEVIVGLTVEVIPEVAHTIAVGDPGQIPLTAIPVGVGVRAGDEGAGEVTATGAQTADPGLTAPPVAVLPGAEVTVAAVGTVEPHLRQAVRFTSTEREQNNKVWTLYTQIANYFYRHTSATKAPSCILF